MRASQREGSPPLSSLRILEMNSPGAADEETAKTPVAKTTHEPKTLRDSGVMKTSLEPKQVSSPRSNNARSSILSTGRLSSYSVPDSYANLDEIAAASPVENRHENPTIRQQQLDEVRRREGQASWSQRPSPAGNYSIPDWFSNLDEVAAVSPVENPHELYSSRHENLEEIRRGEVEYPGDEKLGGETQKPGDVSKVSRHATEIYTVSHLILFSLFGTLARVGLTALTSYEHSPVTFTTVWANFAGSFILGFLVEDRMLFLNEWGTPTYDRFIQSDLEKRQECDENGSGAEEAAAERAAAKETHLATKKTIPLYIGLAVGFCGSLTSFSAFIRDVFLAISNDLATPGAAQVPDRNGGYAFMGVCAIIITTLSLCLSGLFLGAHAAIALENLLPSIPYEWTRKILDPMAVVLGWGGWLTAVLISILPPTNAWRGQITIALVLAPLGCLLRFYLSLSLNRKQPAFPLGTFIANMLGTLVLGIAYDIQHASLHSAFTCQVMQGIEDGFCGCLTTISTWVAELTTLKRKHAYIYGPVSILLSTALLVITIGSLRWTDKFAMIECRI